MLIPKMALIHFSGITSGGSPEIIRKALLIECESLPSTGVKHYSSGEINRLIPKPLKPANLSNSLKQLMHALKENPSLLPGHYFIRINNRTLELGKAGLLKGTVRSKHFIKEGSIPSLIIQALLKEGEQLAPGSQQEYRNQEICSLLSKRLKPSTFNDALQQVYIKLKAAPELLPGLSLTHLDRGVWRLTKESAEEAYYSGKDPNTIFIW